MNFFYRQSPQPVQPQPAKPQIARLQSTQAREPGGDVKKGADEQIASLERQIVASQKQVAVLTEQVKRDGKLKSQGTLTKINTLRTDIQRKQLIVAELQRNSLRMDNAVAMGKSSRLMQDMSNVVEQELKSVSPMQLEKLQVKSAKQDEGLDKLFEFVGGQYANNSEEEGEANDALYEEIMASEAQTQPSSVTQQQQPALRPVTNTNSNTRNNRVGEILNY